MSWSAFVSHWRKFQGLPCHNTQKLFRVLKTTNCLPPLEITTSFATPNTFFKPKPFTEQKQIPVFEMSDDVPYQEYPPGFFTALWHYPLVLFTPITFTPVESLDNIPDTPPVSDNLRPAISRFPSLTIYNDGSKAFVVSNSHDIMTVEGVPAPMATQAEAFHGQGCQASSYLAVPKYEDLSSYSKTTYPQHGASLEHVARAYLNLNELSTLTESSTSPAVVPPEMHYASQSQYGAPGAPMDSLTATFVQQCSSSVVLPPGMPIASADCTYGAPVAPVDFSGVALAPHPCSAVATPGVPLVVLDHAAPLFGLAALDDSHMAAPAPDFAAPDYSALGHPATMPLDFNFQAGFDNCINDLRIHYARFFAVNDKERDDLIKNNFREPLSKKQREDVVRTINYRHYGWQAKWVKRLEVCKSFPYTFRFAGPGPKLTARGWYRIT